MMGPRDRAPSFKLEIPGDRDYQNVFMSNLKAVRLQLKEITNAKAEELLTAVIRHSVLYKSARDFVLGKESYLVESFNNLMNVFQDKRISYGNPQYLARSQIAVCHWNENQGRPCTSRWHPKSNPRAPRCKNGKKNYVACTYKYRDSVWDRHIVKLFKSQ